VGLLVSLAYNKKNIHNNSIVITISLFDKNLNKTESWKKLCIYQKNILIGLEHKDT
jgi:hypothetical protein